MAAIDVDRGTWRCRARIGDQQAKRRASNKNNAVEERTQLCGSVFQKKQIHIRHDLPTASSAPQQQVSFRERDPLGPHRPEPHQLLRTAVGKLTQHDRVQDAEHRDRGREIRLASAR